MIKLSIIIPTLNAAGPLEQCLASIGTGGKLVVELIVSDGGSKDDTTAIALSHGANVVVGPAGRGAQLRRGAKAAGGDWFLFLHADSRLDQGWADLCAGHMSRQNAGAAAFRLRFRASGLAPQLVAGWANLRSRLGLPYGDQGLLIRADQYEQIGGYPDQPLMEDVEIAKRLSGKIKLLRAAIETGAERYQSEGWFKRGAKNLGLLARYKMGADPRDLVRAYARSSVASSEEN